MVLADWLLVASLGVSLFAVGSAIAVARSLRETQAIVDILMFRAQLEIMIKQAQEEEENE
mgnify:CR=1 FL=1